MNTKGYVHKYGDNVDTDVIIPARYLNTSDPAELASHCMEDIDKDFTKKVRSGDIIVGGANFGCGSSREHAPLSIKASGAQLGFVDRFSGTVILTGTFSEVEASLKAVVDYAEVTLGFTVCKITKT